MVKEKCKCGKDAVWVYAPGYTSGQSPYFCDDCVNRGCECNHYYVAKDAYHPELDSEMVPEGKEGKDWKWIEEDKIWCYIDDQEREYPCCEYFYDREGFEIE
jgi:hypothetical protein